MQSKERGVYMEIFNEASTTATLLWTATVAFQ